MFLSSVQCPASSVLPCSLLLSQIWLITPITIQCTQHTMDGLSAAKTAFSKKRAPSLQRGLVFIVKNKNFTVPLFGFFGFAGFCIMFQFVRCICVCVSVYLHVCVCACMFTFSYMYMYLMYSGVCMGACVWVCLCSAPSVQCPSV